MSSYIQASASQFIKVEDTAYINVLSLHTLEAVNIYCDYLQSNDTIRFKEMTNGAMIISDTTIIGLSAPGSNSEATNKEYVDRAVFSYWKEPALVATTAPLANLSGIPANVDDVLVGSGSRILVKDQVDQVDNGIYIISPGAWERSSDLLLGSHSASTTLWIETGAMNGGYEFRCEALSGSDIVGTNDLSWDRVNVTTDLEPGIGLYAFGTTINVGLDGSTLTTTPGNNRILKLTHNNTYIYAGDGITGGGQAILGSSVNLSVDDTVIRTSGTQTIDGTLEITGSVITGDLVSESSTGNVYCDVTGIVNIGTSATEIILGSSLTNISIPGTLTFDTLTSTTPAINVSLYDNLISGNISLGTSLSSGTITIGSLLSTTNLNGNVLVEEPTQENSVATKSYVDKKNWKMYVLAATTGQIVTFGPLTIDGVPVTTGDRVLVKDQGSAIDNGIYDVSTIAWTRSDDCQETYVASGAVTVVMDGLDSGGKMYYCSTQESVFGLDANEWNLISGGGGGGGAPGGIPGSIQFKSLDVPYIFDGSADITWSDMPNKLSITGSVECTGEMKADGFLSTSDAIMKSDFEELNGALNKVRQIECYEYILSDTKKYGIVAQQLETLGLSHIVSRSRDHDYVDYSQLIPLIIQAIKEITIY